MPDGKLRIYFSGIGGSGVSAIASFMHDRGHAVAGSDRAFEAGPVHPAYKTLKAKGIAIVPQDGSALDGAYDLMVMSTAVEADRPEVLRAGALGIPMKTRPEYLAKLVSEFSTVAVTGTSGKSTAAGMLAFLMRELGLRPNFIGGGRVKAFKNGSNAGNAITGDSDLLVVEACESDGSIIHFRPAHSVILNLDLDHHGIEETARMFKTLLENTSGKAFMNADDENLNHITPPDAVTFSLENPSRYRAVDVALLGLGSEFTVNGTRFSLPLPGRHNVHNALSCIAVLSEAGIPPERTAEALPGFTGIERRFDLRLRNGKKLVIDDYAHNPHKIRSLMETMKTLGDRVCYIFQPHGYGPVRLMKDEYIRAFSENLRDADRLVLLPIFYAGGAASKDISSDDLAEGISARNRQAVAVRSRKEALEKAEGWDACVVFGARDETLTGFADDIALSLGKK